MKEIRLQDIWEALQLHRAHGPAAINKEHAQNIQSPATVNETKKSRFVFSFVELVVPKQWLATGRNDIKSNA